MVQESEWYVIPDKKTPPEQRKAIQRERAALMVNHTARIEERQYAWHQLNLWNSALYNNRQLVGFRWGADINDQAELWPINLRTENLVENIGQSMVAKAASSPLKPTLVPHGASWKTARAVKTGDRFVYGLWKQTHAEEACLQMFNDAYTSGLGCLQVHVDGDKVCVEPVFFDNIVIDNRECANRALPRTVRLRKVVHIDALKAMWPKDVEGDTIGSTTRKYLNNRPQGKEWEVVIEIYRRPDKGKKNGYHAIIACDQIIFEEVWKEDWLPLVFFHWQDRQSGFFVKSGVEQVMPYQLRSNELNDVIEENQRISCQAGMMAPAATEFDWSQWKSEAGRVVLYNGMEPKPLEIPTNLAELYAERQRNKEACYSHMGLNEMFSMADFAPSVRFDSSAGLREARNMEDARHLRLWLGYERARLELARCLLRMVGQLGKDDFSVIYKPYGASFAGTEVQWKDIKHLNEQDYEWEMAPGSLAQMSPAARRENLQAKISRGQDQQGIGQDGQMVTQPDLELIERMELASEEDIERHIELLESGKYEPPGLMTNKVKGMMMITANYHRLRRYKDLEEDDPIILNHERWIVQAAAKQKEAMMMQQPQQMVPFAPTQGVAGTNSGGTGTSN